jgi:hypothetical protein
MYILTFFKERRSVLKDERNFKCPSFIWKKCKPAKIKTFVRHLASVVFEIISIRFFEIHATEESASKAFI